jgi:cyclophilin family peptidyl-prolyl cis-trans isomerase
MRRNVARVAHGREGGDALVRATARRHPHRRATPGSLPAMTPPPRTVARACLVALLGAAVPAGLPAQPPGDAAAAARARRDPGDAWFHTPAPEAFRVALETTQGRIELAVTRAWAPIGADRFYHLVRAGFYDDQYLFRVRAGFIAQWGIPGDPAIAAPWYRATIPDDPRVVSNTRGTVAYAFITPGTRTTQLFISLGDNTRLDAEGFAPFARVVEGMEVADRLHAGYDEGAGGGMRGGRQGRIVAEGNAHLARDFPRLDRIITARLLSP